MADFTELELKLLTELEEAGSEDLLTLQNTLLRIATYRDDRTAFVSAINQLIAKDAIVMACELDSNRRWRKLDAEDAYAAIKRFDDALVFDDVEGLWQHRAATPRSVNATAIATELGLAAGREVLTQRGYGWWR